MTTKQLSLLALCAIIVYWLVRKAKKQSELQAKLADSANQLVFVQPQISSTVQVVPDPYIAPSPLTVYCQPTFQSITTEVGTVPTTAAFIMPPGSNMLALYTTHKSGSLPGYKDVSFPIYIQVGTGPIKKVQCYWMNKFIIRATAGQSVKICSDQARTFRVAPHTHPLTQTTPSGFTGTCPTDKAASAFFNPTAGHILLADFNQSFTISATGNRQAVYVRERDLSGNWSGVYSYIVEPNRNLTIQATCKRIALGTANGVSLTIVAPEGTTIDGTSKDERVIIPTPSGTTRVVTAGSESSLRTVLSQAVANDVVVIPDGTYNLTTAVTTATFAANIALGRKGSEGILIRSQSGITANCVIKPINAGWNIDNGGATLATYLLNFAFDCTTGGDPQLGSGIWRTNCKASGINATDAAGTGTGNLFSVVMNNTGDVVDFVGFDMELADASGDNFNFYGNNSYVTNTANSSVYLLNCSSVRCGNFQNSQCITTHSKLSVCFEGGLLSDSYQDVAASETGSVGAYTYLIYSTLSAGARKAGMNAGCALWGCTVLGQVTNSGSDPALWSYQSYYEFAPTTSFTSFLRNSATTFAHNIVKVISGAGTRGIFYSLDVSKLISQGNVFIGFNEAIPHQSYATSPAATAVVRVIGNTFLNCATAISGGDVNATIRLGNNAAKGNTSSIAGVPTGANASKYVSEGGNVFDPTVDPDFIPLSSDSTNADAQLDSNNIPIAGGNCDLKGISLLGFVGGRDYVGRVWLLDDNRIPVGATAVQRVYDDAFIIPDAR